MGIGRRRKKNEDDDEREDAFEEKKVLRKDCSLYGGAEGGGYRKKLLADQPLRQKKSLSRLIWDFLVGQGTWGRWGSSGGWRF